MPWCPRCGTGLSQMEMNEGYQDREDPGLTVRFPLVDRPGEALLVWTTTPWTLAANVAAAVGADLRYVKVRQGEDHFWLGKGTLKQALRGPFQVVEERAGSELAGWRYTGPFDELPAVRRAFAEAGYEHRVVTWGEVGEEEGTGIVHIAPGCGAEDYQLGREIGLPVIGPIDEDGRYYEGFGWLSGREAPDVSEAILDDLEQRRFFYHLEPYSHRYPHCWRCGTPLLFRLVDEWYISMGEVYDRPRDQLTKEEVDASLRYQIMEVVDRIRWIPGFGYERELDWLLNMRDWMISKKRYYGLALPIYDCRACGAFDVIGGREELQGARGRGLGRLRGPHAAPAVRGRGEDRLPVLRRARLAHHRRRQPVAGRRHRAVLDAALPRGPGVLGEVVPGRLHHRELPRPVPQLVLRDARDEHGPAARGAVQDDLRLRDAVRRGRPPHAQELGQRHRVRRGRRAHGRGRHALDVRVARGPTTTSCSAGTPPTRRGAACWSCGTSTRSSSPTPGSPAGRPARGRAAGRGAAAAGPLDPVARPRGSRRRSRPASGTTTPRPRPASWPPTSTTSRPGTCACRGGGCRAATGADRDAAFATLHEALVALARTVAPILPFLSESIYANLVVAVDPARPDSVHLTPWPAPELAPLRDEALEEAMAVARRAVDLSRTLRGAGRPQDAPAARPPLARAAGPGAGGAGRAPRARPRRGERQGRGADRRRVGARGPGRQGAAAARRAGAWARRSRRSWPPPARAASRSTPTGR